MARSSSSSRRGLSCFVFLQTLSLFLSGALAVLESSAPAPSLAAPDTHTPSFAHHRYVISAANGHATAPGATHPADLKISEWRDWERMMEAYINGVLSSDRPNLAREVLKKQYLQSRFGDKPLSRKELALHQHVMDREYRNARTQFSTDYDRALVRAIAYRGIRLSATHQIMLVDFDFFKALHKEYSRCTSELKYLRKHSSPFDHNGLMRVAIHENILYLASEILARFMTIPLEKQVPRAYPGYWAETSKLSDRTERWFEQDGGIEDHATRPPGGDEWYQKLLGPKLVPCADPKVLHPFLAISPEHGFPEGNTWANVRLRQVQEEATREAAKKQADEEWLWRKRKDTFKKMVGLGPRREASTQQREYPEGSLEKPLLSQTPQENPYTRHRN